MTVGDEVFNEMAQELHDKLVRIGADPTNPPSTSPPAARAWAEYQARGGQAYDDPQQFVNALVEQVQALGRDHQEATGSARWKPI